MAAITITEILGGDNIAGSRLTINDNFKRLVNQVNTIDTFLNTSPAGGILSVGEANILRTGGKPDTATIFTCNASGVFAGDLVVSKTLNVAQNVTSSLDMTVGRSVTFAGSAAGTATFNSNISSKFNGQFGSTQFYSSTATNVQTLSPSNQTTRNITSVAGLRVLRVDLSGYNSGQAQNNCDTIVLPAVGTDNQGQLLTIIVDNRSINSMTNFKISPQNLAGSALLTTGIVFSTPNTDLVYTRAVTLCGDTKGWRIINAVGVTIS